MRDTQLYAQILGIGAPWRVTDVQVFLADDEVEIVVSHSGDTLVCPKCGEVWPGYDKPTRQSCNLAGGHINTVAEHYA